MIRRPKQDTRREEVDTCSRDLQIRCRDHLPSSLFSQIARCVVIPSEARHRRAQRGTCFWGEHAAPDLKESDGRPAIRCSRIPLVNIPAWRRSLSAIR